MKVFTSASHGPAKLGDSGGINFQVMNSIPKKLANFSLGKFIKFLKLFNSEDVPLKLIALSDDMVWSFLLIAQYLVSAALNAAVDKSLFQDKWPM